MSETPSLQDELALLESAVSDAAALVMEYFRRDPKSWKKDDVSPVSEADLASDALLKERLTGARPGYGWLSEETEDNDARLDCRSVWVVDPIDGTNAFLQGKPDFTVCAGLVRDREAVAGVVINPVHNQRFTAIKGEGAHLNGKALNRADAASLDSAKILSRKNVMKPERWRNGPPTQRPGYVGSLAYQLCLLAMGERDAAVSSGRLHEWDIAAAGLIFTEAGGSLTNQHGATLQYNAPHPVIDGMIAAMPDLHAEIRQEYLPLMPEGF